MSELLKKIDKFVGSRIKSRREMLGLSQQDLAKSCEISFQQIQKYEAADNRISASRLIQVGDVLRVPGAYFFDGLPNQTPYQGMRRQFGVRQPDFDDPFGRVDVNQLVDLFMKLPSDEARGQVLGFVKMILSAGKKTGD